MEWNKAADLVKSGDAYNAIAVLLEMLKHFDNEKQEISRENQLNERKVKEEQSKGMITGGTVGGTVGWILGSFVPVVGHIVGAAVGGYIGRELGGSPVSVNERQYTNTLFEAETHFRLGIIYEVLHHPQSLMHFQQAKLLNPSHGYATEALQRIQPTITVSPHHLKALDPDR